MADQISITRHRDGWAVSSGSEVRLVASFAEAKALAQRWSPGPPAPDLPSPPHPTPNLDGGGRLSLEAMGAARARLGRSVVVAAGQEPPTPWVDDPRITLTPASIAEASTVAAIQRAFFSRTPVVYVVDGLDAPTPAIVEAPVWSLTPEFAFTAEDTWALLWRNAIDARGAEARYAPDAIADQLDPRWRGQGGWIDGGPLALAAAEQPNAGHACPLEVLEHGTLSALRFVAAPTALAPDQRSAVAEPSMRARIIAPAGSGKTRVLTERARLAVEAGVPTSSLLLVAYNKLAQEELRSRTADLPGLRIQTLNALGLSLLNDQQGHLQGGSRRTVLDEGDVRRILTSLVDLPRVRNADPAASWIEALSRVRLGLEDPAVVEGEANGDLEGFAEFFPHYRAELARRQAVDFDEMLYAAIELLVRSPEARARAQRGARVVLVDEFQDLNPAHLLLLRLLTAPSYAIFGVGDDDQTIYGYSGASPRWLVDFDRYVPAAARHNLEVNYRCPAPVVTAATNLLSRNRERVPKVVRPRPGAKVQADQLQHVSSPHPAAATVNAVHTLLDAGASPEDLAVLTRVNSLQPPVAIALAARGVPVNAEPNRSFLEATGTRTALAWFRLATTQGSLGRGDLEVALQRPSRGLSPKMRDWASDQSSLEALEAMAQRLDDPNLAAKLHAFVGDLRTLTARARSGTSAEIIATLRTVVGLDGALASLDASRADRNKNGHLDDLRALEALGALHPAPATFSAWLTDAIKVPRDPQGVTISTVHRVKGQEWPHVIVHDVTEGVFPHRLSTDLEEERRIFHVAITRASATLTLTSEADAGSRFLAEIAAPGEPAPAPSPRRAAGRQPSRPKGHQVALEVGQVFTRGGMDYEVVEVTPDGVVAQTGTLRTTVAHGALLTFEGRSVTLAATSTTRGAPPGAGDPTVFEALKRWRLQRASSDAVPAYIVATDETLGAIATAMPTTLDDLLAIKGMGPTKVERYGDELLGVLSETNAPSPPMDLER